MVKFYTTSYTYDDPLPTVSLAYFLRYPNPYSTHVLSTDTIDSSFDPLTQTLRTVRLHLKKSKLPTPILKLLPRSFVGATAKGDSQAYILETSEVDIKNGTMKTESRNLEWTGVLSVIERQEYQGVTRASTPEDVARAVAQGRPQPSDAQQKTDVETTVTLRSPLGEQRWRDRVNRKAAAEAGEEQPKAGIFASWMTGSLQRSIEGIGLRRAETSQPNAKEGMKVVLTRLRSGGLVEVLEGMRRDREAGPWARKRIAAGVEDTTDE